MDLEERLKQLEEAQERRHAELLARLEREGGGRLTPGRAAATMTAGYEQAERERQAAAEAAEGGEGE
jgi:hypothetical protein